MFLPTHVLAEHVAPEIVQFVQMNQALAIKLPCIATRLKTVRKEKHKEYLHNVNITPLSPRIEVMLIDDPENCIVSKSDDVNEHESSLSKTDNNYQPHCTVAVGVDSIVKDIDEKRLSISNRNVNS